jgi:hypothetical protein
MQDRVHSLDNLTAATLGNCSPETSIPRSFNQLIRYFLDTDQKHGESRLQSRYFTSCLDPIHERHPEIQNGEIRRDIGGLAYGLGSVPRLPTNLSMGLRFQQPSQQPTYRRIVICDQNTNRHDRRFRKPQPVTDRGTPQFCSGLSVRQRRLGLCIY